MYSRQAQVSEERAYLVSLLHISKDNCVYEIAMICAAYTDPLKKQRKQKSSNNQSAKRGSFSKTDFHPLETWLMFFSYVTLLKFHRERQSQIFVNVIA